MRSRLLVVLAVLAALGGGIGLGALLFNSDGDDDNSVEASDTTTGGEPDGSTTTTGPEQGPTTPATLDDLPATTVPEAGLSGAELELAQAINRAHQLTYHILLRSTPEATSPNETELWRRLPLARRDARLGDGDQTLETREFRSPEGGHIGCLIDTSGTGQTTCLQAPPGSLDPADPILGVIDPSAGPVTATNETLGGVGVPIRCFSQAQDDGTTNVACFDADGIPAVLDGGDGRLERVGEPDRGVADDVFVPPDASFIPNDAGDSGDEEESTP